MCGIAGVLDKSGGLPGTLGQTVLGMLEALGCRGPDSAGVALFAAAPLDRLVLRVKLGDDAEQNGRFAENAKRIIAAAKTGKAKVESSTTAAYLRLAVEETDPRELERRIESSAEGVEVVSMGRQLEIVKQVGSPRRLDETYGVSQFEGRHGIGHTRLSTESKVDLSHSQPFWAHGVPDLAVVHNGHITNYHKLRRKYEQRGTRFYTANDSEIIGVYLAGRLAEGLTLEEAMRASVADLDGSFSYLAARGDSLGFARDQFALKPLMFADTDKFVAVATEEIAIRAMFTGNYRVREAQAREVRVWRT